MNPNQIYAWLGADVVIRNPGGQQQGQATDRPGWNNRTDGAGWGDRNRDRFRDRRNEGWRDRERDDRLRYQRPAFYQQDYIYIPDRGWRPRWFPYMDPYWMQYWDYLYRFYGGYANHAYAERMRDQILRSMATQQGWR